MNENPMFQKIINALESLPEHKKHFTKHVYKDNQQNCCVLGTLSPTLRKLGPIGAPVHLFFERQYIVNRPNIKPEEIAQVKQELQALGFNGATATKLQSFNDKDYKSMRERYRAVLAWLKEEQERDAQAAKELWG